MKVVCIDDSEQELADLDLPRVIKGNVYTVLEEKKEPPERYEKGEYIITEPGGAYYELVECGPDALYHSSMFITINEDQQDETEFERIELVKAL